MITFSSSDPVRLTAQGAETRRVTGTLVRWDTPGRTSMGTVTIPRGTLTLPDPARIRLLYGHDRDKPVGVAVRLDDTSDGLLAEFLIARTPLGDQYLAELVPDAPIRDGLSIELDDVAVEGSTVGAGVLNAVAAVPLPAFPDSRAALAAQLGETMPDIPDPAPSAPDAPTAPLTAAEPPARPLGPTPTPPARTAPVSPFRLLCERLTEGRMTGRVGPELAAALADIKPSGNGAGNEAAALMVQALGELWSASAFIPRYRPLVSSGKLTGFKAVGFTWTVPPAVDDYAGNKTAIPSTAATLDYVEVAATRLAGGHDIDRIYTDLGTPEMMASYWARMAESLGRGLDGRALTAIQAAAGTPVTGQTDPLVAIVLGSIEVSKYGAPAYALVSSDIAAAMAITPASQAPIGAPFTLPPVVVGPELPAATVIVGAREAVRQLTFEPPIRAEAVNVPNGGIDAALFSYSAELAENAAAVIAYTIGVVTAAKK